MSRAARVDPVVAAMEKMQRQREARRKAANKFRRERLAEEKRNEREGRPGDVDFQRLIKKWRRAHTKETKEVRCQFVVDCVCVACALFCILLFRQDSVAWKYFSVMDAMSYCAGLLAGAVQFCLVQGCVCCCFRVSARPD